MEIPAFQGPLDLLLQLIQQEKVDIYDIPIAKITDQYIAVVRKMEEVDMEITSEFLLLAAQLLYIKSRYLLPKPEKQEIDALEASDPREELIARLQAYSAFKQVAVTLGDREISSGQRYFRTVDIDEIIAGFPPPDPLSGVTFQDIWQAFCRIVERAEKGEEIQEIEPEEIALEVVVKDILRRLLLHKEGIRFHVLLRGNTRIELVTSFLALLELLKQGKVRAEQDRRESDIYLFPTAEAWEFGEEE